MATLITFSSQRTSNNASQGCAVPWLLVSVRSREEAIHAIQGGAQILDIKEPAFGSLGMAEVEVIREIAGSINDSSHTSVPLSVALGELNDWIGRSDIPVLPAEVTFAKLGLSDLAGANEWQKEWQRIRHEFDRRRDAPLQWVAVAYADNVAARSPSLHDVLLAAAKSGCCGLLIDTYVKQGQTMADFVSAARLQETVERCHAAGMFLAIAGSLTIETLQVFGKINADIVAIRSAACRNANRINAIDPSLVVDFRAALAISR